MLVIDDDAALRELFTRLFERHGFAVDLAADGHEAMSKLAAGEYAVVVLDLMMPRMSGIEVLERVATASPRMLEHIIVATSANANTIDAIDRFGVHVIRKPFDIHDLIGKARACAARN